MQTSDEPEGQRNTYTLNYRGGKIVYMTHKLPESGFWTAR